MTRLAPSKLAADLLSTDTDRAIMLAVLRGLYMGQPLMELANRAQMSIDRATDALHDLLAMREARYRHNCYEPRVLKKN